MTPFPNAGPSDDCFASAYISANGVNSLCYVELKAAVNASGVVRLTPLSTATFNYVYVSEGGPSSPIPLPCKNLNASGLFNGGPSSPPGGVPLAYYMTCC
jgi:hypothetical protein